MAVAEQTRLVSCMPISAGSLAAALSVVAGVEMLVGSVASVGVAIEDFFFEDFFAFPGPGMATRVN